jgi:hypothetical protein
MKNLYNQLWIGIDMDEETKRRTNMAFDIEFGNIILLAGLSLCFSVALIFIGIFWFAFLLGIPTITLTTPFTIILLAIATVGVAHVIFGFVTKRWYSWKLSGKNTKT